MVNRDAQGQVKDEKRGVKEVQEPELEQEQAQEQEHVAAAIDVAAIDRAPWTHVNATLGGLARVPPRAWSAEQHAVASWVAAALVHVPEPLAPEVFRPYVPGLTLCAQHAVKGAQHAVKGGAQQRRWYQPAAPTPAQLQFPLLGPGTRYALARWCAALDCETASFHWALAARDETKTKTGAGAGAEEVWRDVPLSLGSRLVLAREAQTHYESLWRTAASHLDCSACFPGPWCATHRRWFMRLLEPLIEQARPRDGRVVHAGSDVQRAWWAVCAAVVAQETYPTLTEFIKGEAFVIVLPPSPTAPELLLRCVYHEPTSTLRAEKVRMLVLPTGGGALVPLQ